jgi:alkylation response protein AidB-like acyl-CoA dehydrogenase
MGLITDSAEHAAIRASVAAIAKRHGPEYFLERGRTGGGIDELWHDLGSAGLLGPHLPEQYGGGEGWPTPS